MCKRNTECLPLALLQLWTRPATQACARMRIELVTFQFPGPDSIH